MKEELTYTAPSLSPRELIDTFPEAIPAIKRNLKMAKHDLPICEKVCGILLDAGLQYAVSLPVSDSYKENVFIPGARWWWYDSIIDPLKKRIAFLEMLLHISQIKNAGLEKNPLDISRAKNVPISTLIQVNQQGFAHCPFHVDDTPSFRVYTKQNRFHCFSCNFDGDSIDFTQKFYNLDFKSAVKFLNEK
jgi:hypothetical protein